MRDNCARSEVVLIPAQTSAPIEGRQRELGPETIVRELNTRLIVLERISGGFYLRTPSSAASAWACAIVSRVRSN